MNEYIIREVKESDLPRIAEIENECFSDPWSARLFWAVLAAKEANDGQIFLCAEDEDGNAIGYISAAFVLDEVTLENIAVAEGFRRNGIASLLIAALWERVKDFAAFVTLEVRESNAPAIALYEKHGFKRVGMRKNYYEKPRENAVLMTKDNTEVRQ